MIALVTLLLCCAAELAGVQRSMLPSISPLTPPARDVQRIVRIHEHLGEEKMYSALIPLVLADKRPTVRVLANALDVAKGTAWKLKNSLPLQDISNLLRTGRRAALRAIVTAPHQAVTLSIHPSLKQYLTIVEQEALVQLIDARAHNHYAIGKSGIRQFAADIRAQRLKVARCRLPSSSRYYQFERDWLKPHFRPR